MNIATTLLTAGIVSLAPPLASPISSLSISLAGINLSCDAGGCGFSAAETTDFTATAYMSSGSTIRVRL